MIRSRGCVIFMDAEYSCRGGEVVRGVNKARAFLSEQEELVTLSPDQRVQHGLSARE